MLVFCEECGGRNLIPDAKQGEHSVKFRCAACDYENTWLLPQEGRNTEKADKAIAGEGNSRQQGKGKPKKS